jgi:ubiquinone/menaquinone biosynthesis C-methylase UbiE
MMETPMNDEARQNGWILDDSAIAGLSPYEQSFFKNEFLGIRSLNYYEQRLRRIGFENKSHVLDLACGMGQWTVALSRLNGRATGVDLNQGRLDFAKRMATSFSYRNCEFLLGTMEKIPAEDNTFDAVFCYGAFMFSEMPAALAEIRRVCKNDAVIYLNANSIGWYLHLLFDRGLRQFNFSIAKTALRMMARGLRAHVFKKGPFTQMTVVPSYIRALLESQNLQLIEVGPEGTAGTKTIAAEPAYRERFYGFVGLYEYLIRVRKDH